MKPCWDVLVRKEKIKEERLKWVSNKPWEASKSWTKKERRFVSYLSLTKQKKKKTKSISDRCNIRWNKRNKSYQHLSINLLERALWMKMSSWCWKMRSNNKEEKVWQTSKRSRESRKFLKKIRSNSKRECVNWWKHLTKKEERAWLMRKEQRISKEPWMKRSISWMSWHAKRRKTTKNWMPLDRRSSNKETKVWWMRLLSESLRLPWEKDKNKPLRTTESKWNRMNKYLLSAMRLKIREERAW